MKIAINGEILEVSGGGALPAGTVAVKPLTQAEYDALTDAEKQADVVYAITDDGGSGSGGDSSEEIYSTEEVRIGTWIDGKPIYRRVCVFTTDPSLDVVSLDDFDFSEVDNLISGKGTIKYGPASSYIFPTLFTTTNSAFNLDINNGKKSLLAHGA